ncbi:unnamed protein product [Amoebophrya sp. A25]|nr:unnamed protein product [Amoebophrya sp. A25]|eukprot:GSA25T00001580001.1
MVTKTKNPRSWGSSRVFLTCLMGLVHVTVVDAAWLVKIFSPSQYPTVHAEEGPSQAEEGEEETSVIVPGGTPGSSAPTRRDGEADITEDAPDGERTDSADSGADGNEDADREYEEVGADANELKGELSDPEEGEKEQQQPGEEVEVEGELESQPEDEPEGPSWKKAGGSEAPARALPAAPHATPVETPSQAPPGAAPPVASDAAPAAAASADPVAAPPVASDAARVADPLASASADPIAARVADPLASRRTAAASGVKSDAAFVGTSPTVAELEASVTVVDPASATVDDPVDDPASATVDDPASATVANQVKASAAASAPAGEATVDATSPASQPAEEASGLSRPEEAKLGPPGQRQSSPRPDDVLRPAVQQTKTSAIAKALSAVGQDIPDEVPREEDRQQEPSEGPQGPQAGEGPEEGQQETPEGAEAGEVPEEGQQEPSEGSEAGKAPEKGGEQETPEGPQAWQAPEEGGIVQEQQPSPSEEEDSFAGFLDSGLGDDVEEEPLNSLYQKFAHAVFFTPRTGGGVGDRDLGLGVGPFLDEDYNYTERVDGIWQRFRDHSAWKTLLRKRESTSPLMQTIIGKLEGLVASHRSGASGGGLEITRDLRKVVEELRKNITPETLQQASSREASEGQALFAILNDNHVLLESRDLADTRDHIFEDSSERSGNLTASKREAHEEERESVRYFTSRVIGLLGATVFDENEVQPGQGMPDFLDRLNSLQQGCTLQEFFGHALTLLFATENGGVDEELLELASDQFFPLLDEMRKKPGFLHVIQTVTIMWWKTRVGSLAEEDAAHAHGLNVGGDQSSSGAARDGLIMGTEVVLEKFGIVSLYATVRHYYLRAFDRARAANWQDDQLTRIAIALGVGHKMMLDYQPRLLSIYNNLHDDQQLARRIYITLQEFEQFIVEKTLEQALAAGEQRSSRRDGENQLIGVDVDADEQYQESQLLDRYNKWATEYNGKQNRTPPTPAPRPRREPDQYGGGGPPDGSGGGGPRGGGGGPRGGGGGSGGGDGGSGHGPRGDGGSRDGGGSRGGGGGGSGHGPRDGGGPRGGGRNPGGGNHDLFGAPASTIGNGLPNIFRNRSTTSTIFRNNIGGARGNTSTNNSGGAADANGLILSGTTTGPNNTGTPTVFLPATTRRSWKNWEISLVVIFPTLALIALILLGIYCCGRGKN